MLVGYWRASIRLEQKGQAAGGGEVKGDRGRVGDGGGDGRRVFVIKERKKDSYRRCEIKEEDFSYTSGSPDWDDSQLRCVVAGRYSRQGDG